MINQYVRSLLLMLLVGVTHLIPCLAHPTNEVWISDTAIGSNVGTLANPYQAATQVQFDTIMYNLTQSKNMTIHLLPGTYRTGGYFPGWSSVFLLNSNTRLLGSGIDTTIIKVKDNSGFNSQVLGNVSGSTNIVVEELTLDANGQSQTDSGQGVKSSGICFSGDWITLRRIRVINTIGQGSVFAEDFPILLNQPSPSSSGRNIISECIVDSVLGDYTSGIATFGRVTIEKCRVTFPEVTSTLRGHMAYNLQGANDAFLRDCTSSGGALGVYVDTGAWTNVIIKDNIFTSTVRGIFLTPNDNLGNYITNGICDLESVIIADNIVEITPKTAFASWGITVSPMDFGINVDVHGNIIRWARGKNATNGTQTVYGIDINNMLGATVHDNSILDTTPNGIYLAGNTNYNGFNNRTSAGSIVGGASTFTADANQIAFANAINRRTVSASANIVTSDKYIGVATTSAVVLTLPNPIGLNGKEFFISAEVGSPSITIARASGSDKINGSLANITLTTGFTSKRLISNGIDGWYTY
jgi:hypothetical protein